MEHQAQTGNDRGVYGIAGAVNMQGMTVDNKVYQGPPGACVQSVRGDRIVIYIIIGPIYWL